MCSECEHLATGKPQPNEVGNVAGCFLSCLSLTGVVCRPVEPLGFPRAKRQECATSERTQLWEVWPRVAA